MTGGGSGGHITPVLSVAEELKKQQPALRLVYVIGKGDQLIDIPTKHPAIDAVVTIRAGKFRRYHGEGWRQLLDIRTLLKNIRDFFLFCTGIFQARHLLKREKPNVIFIKGGFVGVPVGLAAAWLHIPYVTHDSDALPGLANRIIARWAKVHAVALPVENYDYPPEKTVQVGVPVTENYKLVGEALNKEYRRSLKLEPNQPVLFITGGGLGAQSLNEAIVAASPKLFEHHPKLAILHIAGRHHETAIQKAYAEVLKPEQLDQVTVEGFVTDIYRYSGAADLIVCRAGATSLADFAMQSKACVVVPNPILTGGHQLKNAQALAVAGAIEVIPENSLLTAPELLLTKINELLNSSDRRKDLAKKLHTFSNDTSARVLAELIISNERKG